MDRSIDKTTLDKALSKLETLVVSEGKKIKIRNLLTESTYNGVYASYVLAENPDAFRNTLEHNIQFSEDARNYGINEKVLRDGVEDTGLEITFDIPETGKALPRKIIDYTNELLEIVTMVDAGIRQKLLEDSRNLYHVSELADWEPEFSSKRPFELKNNIVHKDKIISYNVDSSLYTLELEVWGSVGKSRGDKDALEELNKRLYNRILGLYEERSRTILDPVSSLYQKFGQQGEIIRHDIHEHLETQDAVFDFENYVQMLQRVVRDLDALVYDFEYGFITYSHHWDPYCTWFTQFSGKAAQLENHLNDTYDEGPKISSKVKNAKSARYFVASEALHPEDIMFGNDGGCCIAVGSGELGYANAVPFYMLDNATTILGLYQQIGKRKPKRVGIVKAYSTIDLEDQPVFLVNSVELSEAMNPLAAGQLRMLMDHTIDYIQRFSEAAGFKGVGMGNHNYNTAKNYLLDHQCQTPDYRNEELSKLPDLPVEQSFYSEVLTEKGYSKKDSWVWIKRPMSQSE